MEKRTLIALALSFIVLGFYPVVLQKMYPEHYSKKSAVPATTGSVAAAKSAAPSKSFLKAGEFLADDDTPVRSAKLNLVLNRKDGGIREIAFPEYPNSETKAPILFLSLNKAGVSPASVLIASGGDISPVTDYQVVQGGLSQTLSATAMNGTLRIEKILTFDKGYAGRMAFKLENVSSAPIDLQYEIIVGSGIKPRNSIDSQYIEADFFATRDGKKKLKHLKEHRPGKEVLSEGDVEWVAVKDRHFSVVMKPITGKYTGRVRGLGDNDLSASLVSGRLVLPAGGSVTDEFLLYIGPNEYELVNAVGLGDLINFGKFDIIGKLLVGGLELLQKVFRNYGLAIILLTVLINVVLFPLTRMSYMSMKRMQLVQPQMTKLREQHKKSPEKLNKEMMELYKKHKVNPFGGCMPMLMQIPIFIALYVALSKSVILINSRFLWIQDLSTPDRVYLPFTLPFLGNYIHVLPLLMCVAMFLQQKYTQIKIEGQDPAVEQQQKLMATMMPVIFGFIFYQMPSGLVLYWLTNTILMATYQLKLKNMTLA